MLLYFSDSICKELFKIAKHRIINVLDKVFVIFGIIKVEVISVISRAEG